MHKQRIILTIITLALPLWGLGGFLQAQSLKDLFLKMPQEVCPALSEYSRLELVDNQKNNKAMQTRNQFRYVSTMKALTDNYAHLVVSNSSEKELKLLTQSDGSHIIMLISTVHCDSIADSSISFYTTEWTPLDATRYISAPTSTEFRRISIDPASDRLTILTTNPLAIQIDDSGIPAETRTSSQTLLWDATQNQFLTH